MRSPWRHGLGLFGWLSVFGAGCFSAETYWGDLSGSSTTGTHGGTGGVTITGGTGGTGGATTTGGAAGTPECTDATLAEDCKEADGNPCTSPRCVDGHCTESPQPGAPCGVGATCSMGVLKAQDACDSNGDCQSGQETPCAPGVCSAAGDACKKALGQTCASDGDCANADGDPGTHECVNGLCRLLLDQPCEADKPHECATNLCDPGTHTCQECNNNNQCDVVCDVPNHRCQFGQGGICGATADCQPGRTCVNNVCE